MPQLRSPCLGLVGGLGVGATVHYYQALARAHAQRRRSADIVIAHADAGIVLAAVGDRRLDELALYLARFIDRLAAAGATVAALTGIAPHACALRLAEIAVLPVVDIVAVTARHLAAAGRRRVGLLGTRFAMESRLFGRLGTIEAVIPAGEDLDRANAAYMRIVERGSGSDEIRDELTGIARRLIERQGAEAIALAGTELSLVFDAANPAFPTVDCAQLHIDAIMQALAGDAAGRDLQGPAAGP